MNITTNRYGELDPERVNRFQWANKSKREHVVVRNTPNIGYPGQQFDVQISRLSSDASIVPNYPKITFGLEVTSKDKNQGIVNNIGRKIAEKKSLALGGKDINTLDNSDVIDPHIDFYMDKHVKENALLQGIQDADGLKARIGSKKTDGTAFTAEQTAIAATLGNRFSIPLDFAIFNAILHPFSLREDIVVRITLASPSKVLLITGDKDATYKITDICLEFDKIIDMELASTIKQNYEIGYDIPFDKITRIHYEKLSKKDTIWKLKIDSITASSLRGIFVLFVDDANDRKNFACNNKFYNPSITRVLVTINGSPHELYAGGIQPKDYYTEAKKYFDNPNSDVSWSEFLTTKFGLFIDFRSSTDNFLHGSGRTVDKSGVLLQIDKAAEASGDLTCHVFSIADAVLHISNNRFQSLET